MRYILHMLMQIFFFRCHSSPDMALGFVDIANLSCLRCQRRIDLDDSLCYILMYGTLTNSKLFCGLTHSGIVLNDIICDIYDSLLDITFHKKSPAILIVTLYAADFFICLFKFQTNLYP